MKWVAAGWLAVGLGISGVSHAGADDIRACLVSSDVPCAEAEIAKSSIATSKDADLLEVAALTEFYAGRYAEAHALHIRALEAGAKDPYDHLGLFDRTREVTQDFVELRRGDFVVRYRPGVDAVLVENAFRSMERAERHLAPLMGGETPGTIMLEIFPDAPSFTAASSLTEQDVRTTGVVALSKWSRLLMVSPRSLGRGFDWEDTIAHEYIHLVVTHRSRDRAPVWLQEGIAKYLDNRWTDGVNRFHLDPRAEGLLAKAVANDSLVTFEQMHPSLAKLPSADMAALAYAQLASLISFCFEKGGEDVLLRVLPRVREGEDPRQVLAEEAGFESLDALTGAWKSWVKTQQLNNNQIASMPTVLDGEDPVAGDPVLAQRRDLANFMRLGDLLAERGHYDAALIEYGKAESSDANGSPLLATRVAAAYVSMNNWRRAMAAIESSLKDYPDYADSHKMKGLIHAHKGQVRQAISAYLLAVAINPFDVETQEALSTLYTQSGQERAAARHARQLRILRRGGEG